MFVSLLTGIYSSQFYTKIGACRHGEKCSRKHTRPSHSHTIILTNLYRPQDLGNQLDEAKKKDQEFENFYKDIFVESSLIGQVEDLVVCENENDHLNGNVYVKFAKEEDALRARDNFSSRWYNGRPVYCELSPVSHFKDAICRQHETKSCERGGMCNFMHSKAVPRDLQRQLILSQRKFRS